jgi:iron complex outermembrane receptor protein
MRGSFKAFALCVTVSASALAVSQPALGQSAPTAAESDTGLADIVVTARRTNENLQTVPVAASVLSGAALSRQGISTTRDLQYNVPSLVITPDPLGGSSTPIVQLRGQTSPLGTDNTVVTYFGDVPVDARVIAAGVYDLQSVQVIRGPQGTLFGKNSTGGAVVFTPQKATADEVRGFAEVIVGDYGLHQFTGAVNLPIIQDVLAVRFSGQTTDQNGFAKNVAGPDGNDKHWQAGRVVVNFTPSDAIENQTLFTYFNGRQHINPAILQSIAGVSNFFPAVIAANTLQQQLGPRTFSMSESIAPNNDDNESYLIANSTSFHFGGITLKNIFGYSNTHLNLRQNQPAIEFHDIDVLQDRRLHQYSDEVQLSGNSLDNSLKWIVGGFWSQSENTVIQRSRLFSPNITSFSDSTEKYTSKAVFGQATYDFTNAGLRGVKLTAGLRHTWDDRTGSNVQSVPIPVNIKNTHFSWTVGLDYQVTDDILLYVASRHSYKAGGFNLVSPLLPASSLIYDPEILTDVEIGAKAKVNVGTVPVRANLALYRGWYKNIHTQATGTCGGTTGQTSLTINAGKGSPKGLEFELEARLTPNLHVSAFYNRTLGKFDQFVIPNISGCSIGSIPNLTGAPFGNISKDTGGVTAIYTVPMPNDRGELEFTGNMYARSARLGNGLNSSNSAFPGYAIFNARVDYKHVAGSPFSLGVYVRNIGNKLYGVNRNYSPAAGFDLMQYGDPRNFGVVGKVEF